MKYAKNLLAATTLLLLFGATYLRFTGDVPTTIYTGRSGTPHAGEWSATSVLVCAIATGITWCLVMWIDRQKS